MKRVYVVKGSEDGILGVYGNIKAMSESYWAKNAYVVTYAQLLKGIRKDYGLIELESGSSLEIEEHIINK